MKLPFNFQVFKLFPGLILLLLQAEVFSQSPTYSCDIRNHSFVSGTVYEFDLFITRTGSTPLELANYQAGIQVNPALVNGGAITATIVDNTSDLSAGQRPSSISFIPSSNCIRLAPMAAPRSIIPGNQTSSTNGTLIPSGNGARICRIRLTNSLAFGNSPLSPVWSFTVNPYNTVVSAFTGLTDHKVNTVITNSADHSRSLAMKVFLEGPYDASANEMKTSLHNFIPLNQPFSGSPWNYSGSESVTAVPVDIVDWVLVDLRDAASPSLAIPSTSKAVRACFLRKDGTIVSLDGVSSPEFNNVAVNNLYLVTRHRNHLAIMSSAGMTPAGNSYSYDFSTAVTQAYGGNTGYKQIDNSPIRFGMVGGDIVNDGQIALTDFTSWATNGGMTGVYHAADADLDGQVALTDFTLWATNGGVNNVIAGTNHPVYISRVPGICQNTK